MMGGHDSEVLCNCGDIDPCMGIWIHVIINDKSLDDLFLLLLLPCNRKGGILMSEL